MLIQICFQCVRWLTSPTGMQSTDGQQFGLQSGQEFMLQPPMPL